MKLSRLADLSIFNTLAMMHRLRRSATSTTAFSGSEVANRPGMRNSAGPTPTRIYAAPPQRQRRADHSR